MKRMMFVLAFALMVVPAAGHAQGAAADSAAIRAAALNYIEGWYEGDAERMRSALHPDLAKRIVRSMNGQSRLGHMTADQLVNATASGGGRGTAAAQRRSDVRIQDVFGNAAVVRVDATDWVDFLQLAKTERGWVIVNVLWEMR